MSMLEAAGPVAYEVAKKFVQSPVDKMEKLALENEIEDIVPVHFFSDGVYARPVIMTSDKPLIIGHRHKTRHLNLMMTGAAFVSMDGKVQYMEAPRIFESQAGVRKSLYIVEDVIWVTVHPTKEGEEEYSQELEDRLVEKSDDYREYVKEREALMDAVKEREEK